MKDDNAASTLRVARLPPDAHGLTVLPFLAGERSPDYLPDARAVIAGLRLATTRDEIFRAGLEVGRLPSSSSARASSSRVSPVTRLVATGARADRLARLAADPGRRARPPDCAAARDRAHQPRRGDHRVRAARRAARGKAEPAIARVFHPDARSHAVYREAAAAAAEAAAALC